jgi:hypothetical protein
MRFHTLQASRPEFGRALRKLGYNFQLSALSWVFPE